MVQPAPKRGRQPVAWAGMQSTRVPLRRPANDNRRSRRNPLLYLALALALGGLALLLIR